MTTRRFARAGLAVLGLVSAVAGAGCGAPPAETGLRVRFVRPLHGDQLLANADEDPIQAGHQTTVEVVGSDTGERNVTLASGVLEVRPPGGAWVVFSGTPEVEGATVRFPGATIPALAELHVSVEEAGSGRRAETYIGVSVQPGRPRVVSVTVQGDANQDLRLNATELPSGAPVLTIETFGVDNGGPLAVRDPGGNVLASTTVTDGTALVTLPSLASATEQDFPLVIEVTGPTGLTNNTGPTTPGYPTNSEALPTLRIDRVAPTVVVTAPTNGAFIGAGADTNAVLPGVQVAVTGTTAQDVGAGGIELVLTPPGGTSLGDAIAGAFSGTVTGAEGAATLAVTATDTSGNRGATVNRSVTFDFTPPGVSGVTCGSGVVPASGTYTFVAASNVHLVGVTPPDPGYVADLTPGGDAQTACGATVTGATGGTFRVRYAGSSVFGPVTPGSASELIAFGPTLPHGTTGTLRLELADAAGNTANLDLQTTVDVQAPSNPGPNAVRVASPSRQVAVDVTWSASGDDGVVGTPAGYDVRYRPQALFDEPSPASLALLRLRDDASFFHPSRTIQVGGGLQPTTSFAVSLTNLPPWSEFSVSVRAVDEVGNYSAFTTDAFVPMRDDAVTGATTLDNPEGTGGNSRFGYNLAAADFNGDGRSDLAVGEPFDTNTTLPTPGTLAAKVFVVYGQADLSAAFPAPQALLAPEPTTVQRYGRDLSAGNVGDSAAAEGRPDLLVSAWRAFSFAGRALVYFGRTALPLDTTLSAVTPRVLDFRGEAASWLGYTARIVPDFGGPGGAPDGLAEVLLVAPSAASNRGRVYLFWGRPQDDWLSLAGGSIDATAGTYAIPVTLADRIFEGSTCSGAGTPPCWFGTNHGFVNLGDVNSDSVPDLAIPQSNDLIDNLYVYSGAAIQAAAAGTVFQTSAAIATLTQDSGNTGTVTLAGFGAEAERAPSLFGSTGAGLAVSLPRTSQIFLYSSFGSTTAVPTQTLTSAYPLRQLGTGLAVGDFNGDGLSDLIAGENAYPPGGSTWVLYNTGSTTAPFDAVVGGGPRQSRVFANRSLGIGVAVGDFNGDSRLDFASGDPGITGEPGEVRIFF